MEDQEFVRRKASGKIVQRLRYVNSEKTFVQIRFESVEEFDNFKENFDDLKKMNCVVDIYDNESGERSVPYRWDREGLSVFCMSS